MQLHDVSWQILACVVCLGAPCSGMVVPWLGIACSAMAWYGLTIRFSAGNVMMCHGLKHHAVTRLCIVVLWCALPWLDVGCSNMVFACSGLALGFIVVSL